MSNQNEQFKPIQAMITIAITPEIKSEIIQGITYYQNLIEKEMQFPEDLRHNHKIERWNNAINKYLNSLEAGFI